MVCDVDRAAVDRARALSPSVEVMDVDALPSADLDVFAPCALGGALNDQTADQLRVRIVCGGANNQLARPEIAKTLDDRGVLYVPDYVVNAGGLIHVADEYHGYSEARVRAKVAEIFHTTSQLLQMAADSGEPPSVTTDRIAEERIATGTWQAPSPVAGTDQG